VMVQFNLLMFAFLTVFVTGALVRRVLTALNIRHLRHYGRDVPPVFAGEIDAATLVRMNDYTIENSRFSSWEGVSDDLLTLAVLLSGLLPWFVGSILALKLHFVISGLILFGALALISAFLGLPFELYQTFGIERNTDSVPLPSACGSWIFSKI